MTENEIFQLLESILGRAEDLPDRNGDAVFLCPNCNHTKPHLVVNIRKTPGLYHCWICEFSSRGHAKSLKRLGFVKESKLFADEHSILREDLNQEYILKLLYDELENKKQDYNKELNIPDSYKQLYFYKNSFQYNIGNDYLIKRGIHEDDLLKYNIHYSIEERRVLFPSYDSSLKLNYYVARSVDDDVFNKYDNPELPKIDIVFNEHLINWNKELFIVEGVFDSVISRKNSIPLLGSSLKKDYRLTKLIGQNKTPVVLSLDPDAFEKQCNIAELLIKNNISVKVVDMRDETRDIAEMGTDEYEKYVKSHIKQFDFSEMVSCKI